MKTFITLFTTLIALTFSQTTHAQIYVNGVATGNNDGTSWGDAYNDLQDALTNAAADEQIWVAVGTYLPGTTETATYRLTRDVQLYGGFAGTESSITERMIENNPTILSGDLNGDDIIDDFSTNRTDNATNIMYIDSTVTNGGIIDGFIFEGGHADAVGSPDLNSVNGAGVWSYGAAQFSNCIFRQNYADNTGGGCVFFNELSEGGKVMNCIFENNTGDAGGGLIVSNVPGIGIEVEGCRFTNNHSNFTGGGLVFENSKGEIINSIFTNNSSDLAAGAIYVTHTTENFDDGGTNVLNCTFENNKSSNAGALGFQTTAGGHNFFVKKCTFRENAASEIIAGQNIGGGALFFYNFSEYITAFVDSCHFENNDSENLGGAVVFYDNSGTTNNKLEIRNTLFHSNMADYGGGISTVARGMNQELSLMNCEFLNNKAEFSGGGYRTESADENLQISVDNCIFDSNDAIEDAGGFEVSQLGDGKANLSINNTQFLNNISGNKAGGFNFYTKDNGTATIDINHSLFDGNSNDDSGNPEEDAGGFSLINYGIGTVVLNFESSIIRNNTSLDGAGAIQLRSFGEDEVKINNCLIVNNSGGDNGGGIGLNDDVNLSIINTTIANNNNGITNSLGALELQNTILYNPGGENYKESGSSSSATSLGGNLLGDESLMNVLLPTDQSGIDPLFEGNGDYRLKVGSPAVDAGLDAGVTVALDLAGNVRVQGNQVDVGAYESPFTVSTKEVLTSNKSLNLYPNPATDFLNIQLENNWIGNIQVDIVNVLGQKIYSSQFSKAVDEYADNVQIGQLASGTYQLILSTGQERMVKTFTKVD